VKRQEIGVGASGKRHWIGIGMMVLASAALGAPGDRVLVQRRGELYGHAGTILAEKENTVEVLFDVGGRREAVSRSETAPLWVRIGTRVYGNWRGKGVHYPGTITLVEGERVRVQYEDGDQETTSLGKLKIVPGTIDHACVEGEAIFAALDPGGVFYHPGTVRGFDEERVRIRVVGASEDTLVPADRTRTFVLKKGDRVLGRWQAGPGYFLGRVEAVKDDRVEILYDDGDREWTSLGFTILLDASPGAVGPGHCLDRSKAHRPRRSPLALPPLPAKAGASKAPADSI
jgi:hypothetical protein